MGGTIEYKKPEIDAYELFNEEFPMRELYEVD